jgi:hypothetical protein
MQFALAHRAQQAAILPRTPRVAERLQNDDEKGGL